MYRPFRGRMTAATLKRTIDLLLIVTVRMLLAPPRKRTNLNWRSIEHLEGPGGGRPPLNFFVIGRGQGPMNACCFAIAALLLVGCSAQAAGPQQSEQPPISSKRTAVLDRQEAAKRFRWHGHNGTVSDLQFSSDDTHLLASFVVGAEVPPKGHIIVNQRCRRQRELSL
jgi:hypothetical protein